jgi:hypothetical protein
MLAFLGISVFGFVVAGQVSELGASLPRYEYNIREKIRSVQSRAPGGGLVERAAKVLATSEPTSRKQVDRRRTRIKHPGSSRKLPNRIPSRFKSDSPTQRPSKCFRPSSGR